MGEKIIVDGVEFDMDDLLKALDRLVVNPETFNAAARRASAGIKCGKGREFEKVPFAKSYQCDVCGETFKDNMKSKGVRHHAPEITCPYCGASHFEDKPPVPAGAESESRFCQFVEPQDEGKLALTLSWRETSGVDRTEYQRANKLKKLSHIEIATQRRHRTLKIRG